MNNWTNAIKTELRQRRMQQKALALHLGISDQYLSTIMRSGEASFPIAQQIENLLGVSMDLWYASRGRVPEDLIDRYGVKGLAEQFQRMREG